MRARKGPPADVAEPPLRDRPRSGAVWVTGYWAWDATRGDYYRVPGTWRMPPKGMSWVGGRWGQDRAGWVWTPGYWEETRAALAAVEPGLSWRRTGPPVVAPVDTPGEAPDASAFYVPGHFQPEGDGLAWVKGFWSQPQEGWDWVPARWVRKPDGWDFREGYWASEKSARHVVARPRDDGSELPPAIVESEPMLPTGMRRTMTNAPPIPSNPVDPIARLEDGMDPDEPFVASPVTGRTYRAAPPTERVYVYGPPPRRKLYDPTGIVGQTTPPFVRRMLDRILP